MEGVRASQSKFALCIPVCSYGPFSTLALLLGRSQQHTYPALCREAGAGLSNASRTQEGVVLPEEE